jgi:hypothetical protein
MEEPSVLDYVISKLAFWKNITIEIPPAIPDEDHSIHQEEPIATSMNVDRVRLDTASTPLRISWLEIIILSFSVIMALIAQRVLEPPDRNLSVGIVLYAISLIGILWIILSKGLGVTDIPVKDGSKAFQFQTEQPSIVLGAVIIVFLTAITYLFFGDNRFTFINTALWMLTLFTFIRMVWIADIKTIPFHKRFGKMVRSFIDSGITAKPWTILLVASFLLVAFFRLYQLNEVPAEMFSDHAEKLLDVSDVLDGQTSVFFIRNTGREAIQMYLTAAVARIFKTGLSFDSLKIGTILAGLFTLPFIYLLGKEIANRQVGLYAMLFAGIAYWPNVISRVALRFALYPLFVAPMLFYLVRGLKNKRRNDFILSGIALGLGMHGYSPFRFVPIVVLVAVGLYLLHRQSRGARLQTIYALLMLVVVSLIIFLPLMRFALDNPEMFSNRMLTRIGTAERPYPDPPLQIFIKNLWHAMTMFFWDNGNIWVHSVPGRPALDIAILNSATGLISFYCFRSPCY